jgi:hypothetical protein
VQLITVESSESAAHVKVRFSFSVEPENTTFVLTSNLLAAVDPLHRVVLRVVKDGRTDSKVLHGGCRTMTLPELKPPGPAN